MRKPLGPLLMDIHKELESYYGELHWWPADSSFEILVGAILTQNTSWKNVEKAIGNLKRSNNLHPSKISAMSRSTLEALIRPSGCFRQKAERLQALSRHLQSACANRIQNLWSGPLEVARQRLLTHRGIGQETADCILLYAAHQPSFVIDAYTRRVFSRIGVIKGTEAYETIRTVFMRNLPDDVRLYGAYHAEIVQLSKDFCRKHMPICLDCPLARQCDYARKFGTERQHLFA